MPKDRLVGHLPPAAAASDRQGTNWLLAIGIDNYAHHPKLHKAVADAQGFAEMLTTHYGFEHLSAPLYNETATQHNIRKALSKCKTLTEHDRLIVFYAGHGWYEAKTRLGHIVPTDAENNPDSDFIPTNFITNIFQGVDAKHILLVVDCCFGGSFGVERTLFDVETAKKVNTQLDNRRSRMVLSSGGIEPVSDGLVSANNSPFTQPLLAILDANKAPLMVFSEVFNLLRKKANWATSEQLPQYKVLQGLGHNDGELGFYCTDPVAEIAEEVIKTVKSGNISKAAQSETPTFAPQTPQTPPEDTLKDASQVFLGSLVISVPIALVYAILFYFLIDTHSYTYIYVSVFGALFFPISAVLSTYNEKNFDKSEGWGMIGFLGLPVLIALYTAYAGFTGDFKPKYWFASAQTEEVPVKQEDPSVKTDVGTVKDPQSGVKIGVLPKGTVIGTAVKRGEGVQKSADEEIFEAKVFAYNRDFEKAAPLLIKHKDNPDFGAEAQAALGHVYAEGYGVLQDDAEAAKWFRKSAEQGNGDGQLGAALLYEHGRGGAKNVKEAVRYYRLAAKQGYEKGKEGLKRLRASE